MSIGISEFTPKREVTSSKLLAEADHALYEAKEAGRNKVISARPRVELLVHD